MSEIVEKTEMEVIVKGMAALKIPEEILKGANYKELMQGLKQDFNHLDDLKNVRQAYESRSFGERVWDTVAFWKEDKLEAAKLDAAELQASFSKKLGQLLIISHAQSLMLDHQQRDLQKQQHEIRSQTQDIADANGVIAKQQGELGKQQDQLETLINDYFELKGLTADGAKRLIQIAEEIKGTKSSLMATFESQHQEHLGLMQRIEDCGRQQIAQAQQLDAYREEVGHAMTSQGERFDAGMATHREEVDKRLLREAERFHTEQQALKQWQEQQAGQQRQFMEQQLGELKKNTALQISRAKRLATIGLCGASFTFLWLLWEHRAAVGF